MKKVKVIEAGRGNWYKVGEVYEVEDYEGSDMLYKAAGRNVSQGDCIYKHHCEDVVEPTPEPKFYELEGKKYVLPEWAKYVTRDNANARVFGWECKPEWTKGGGYFTDDGKRGVLQQYVEPLPEGNIFVTL